MSAGLRRFLAITDVLMLGYWLLTTLAALGVIVVPPYALYRDYHNPLLIAWNWSFLPLDIAFSLLGLLAVRQATHGRSWRGLAIASLVLTSCAGGMAIAFWTLRGDFDPSWWIPNLLLWLLPWWWLPNLIREVA